MYQPLVLWYRQSATCLNEALPIGNGKLAAMVYGGGDIETIQLDESTFWSGEPSEKNNRTDTPKTMDRIRQLLLAYNYEEADRIGHDYVGVKNCYGTHMPCGNLRIEHLGLDAVSTFERGLDIMTGVAYTQFEAAGTYWRRECFASHPAGVFALRYNAQDNRQFSMRISFAGIENNVHTTQFRDNDLLIQGNAFESLHSDGKTGVSLAGRIRLLSDGSCDYCDNAVMVKNATSLVLLGALETTMTGKEPDVSCIDKLNKAQVQGWQALYDAHCADIYFLMVRQRFTLGENDTKNKIPTDQRISSYAKHGGGDPALLALAYQYGRYTLIASSRGDSPLPTHMGGIWNDNIYNKQDSTQDMHIDMNVQMQYWLAFSGGLAECALPLANWLQNTIVPSGEKTAREEYGARGWVAHVTSNPWGYTSLGWAYNWGSFTFGGAWCATLLWDHYEYTRDLEFLKNTTYPILLGAAQFMLDYMFFDEASGFWMTGPSYSPENHFSVDGKSYVLSLSTTCDVLLVREIFECVLRASKELALPDNAIHIAVRDRLSKLPPYKVGQHGQLQEWFFDFVEHIPNHRHLSHLLGLYPFSQISPEHTPALANAAAVSVNRRLKDFEVTSWGYNMLCGMYARLYNGEAALSMLNENIRQLTKPNLTIVMPSDVSMWAGTWELDGNTGVTSSIAEMIAQSQECGQEGYVLRLLPALPSEWSEGELTGLRLRGGVALDICWQAGRLKSVGITVVHDLSLTLIYDREQCVHTLRKGRQYLFNASLTAIENNKA